MLSHCLMLHRTMTSCHVNTYCWIVGPKVPLHVQSSGESCAVALGVGSSYENKINPEKRVSNLTFIFKNCHKSDKWRSNLFISMLWEVDIVLSDILEICLCGTVFCFLQICLVQTYFPLLACCYAVAMCYAIARCVYDVITYHMTSYNVPYDLWMNGAMIYLTIA